MCFVVGKKGGKVIEDKGKDKIVRCEFNKVYMNGIFVDEVLFIDE